MIEELAEAVLRPLSRLLVYVLGEILWHVVCHAIGWIVLRILTLGRHPRGALFSDAASGAAEVVGALMLIALGAALAAALW